MNGLGSTRNLRAVSVLLLAGLIALVRASPAAAQADADRLFDDGVAAFEGGDYAGALRAFEESYAVVPASETLLNIGMCRRLVGDAPGAVNALLRYVVEQRGVLLAEERSAIEAQLEDLAPAVGQIAFDVPDRGARLFVDGVEVGVSPLGVMLAVEPGEHEVEARREGLAPTRISVRVEAGYSVTAALGPPPPLAAPPIGAEADDGLGWWFWGSVIATGALGAGLAVTGGLTLKYRADCCDGDVVVEQRTYDSGIALATTTDVLLGLAVGAAVSALIALLVDGDGEEMDPTAGTTAFALPGSFVLAW